MQMAGRSFTSGDGYRYGFNGMERDDEISGSGNAYNTEFRGYDPRLGKWKSLDPLKAQFPWQSPYVAFDNNPIIYTDPRGLAATGKDQGKENKDQGKEKKDQETKPPVEAINLSDVIKETITDMLFKPEDPDLPEEIKQEAPLRGRRAREIRTPDAAAITISSNTVAGAGGSKSLSLVYVKGEGFGLVGTVAGGVGLDVSGGAQFQIAWSGDNNPALSNFVGKNVQVNAGFNVISVSYFVDQ
jgi:RHS repeat-associated protein